MPVWCILFTVQLHQTTRGKRQIIYFSFLSCVYMCGVHVNVGTYMCVGGCAPACVITHGDLRLRLGVSLTLHLSQGRSVESISSLFLVWFPQLALLLWGIFCLYHQVPEWQVSHHTYPAVIWILGVQPLHLYRKYINNWAIPQLRIISRKSVFMGSWFFRISSF